MVLAADLAREWLAASAGYPWLRSGRGRSGRFVPAAELVWLQAETAIALAPPRTVLSVEHAIGHGDLAGEAFTLCFTPQRARQAVAPLLGYGHKFPPDRRVLPQSEQKDLSLFVEKDIHSDTMPAP